VDGIRAHWTLRERISRLRRRLRGRDHTIRLAPDYGASLPLWPGEKAGDPEEYLPPELLNRLSGWQRYWDSHHDYQSGWDSKDAQARWKLEGQVLADEIRSALPSGVKLRVDF
jgi:hypothetical protein